MSNVIESAVSWAQGIARDNSHGYDQQYRWNERGDYDCSSLVISAYKQAGVPLTCTYTGNMRADMLRKGFADVTNTVNLVTGAGVERGDVLLNEVHHTALALGNGRIVHASGNEFGGATGGVPGDQTGGEICERSYYNSPWDCVLRYCEGNTENGTKSSVSAVSFDNLCSVTLPELSKGDINGAVLAMQNLLVHKWAISCGKCGVDGDFGGDTEAAVKAFQSANKLAVDGVCGENTWRKLIGG